MKKRRFAALCPVLGLAISAGLPAQAGAHSGDRLFPIPELTDEMLARIDLKDGLADEWHELVGEPTLTLLDFRTFDNRLPDPSDLDFRIWLAWHDDPDRLFVAFVSSDDSYKNTHDYNGPPGDPDPRFISVHDSIDLAIDGDHGGGEGYGNFSTLEEAERIAGETQLYQAISRTASGPTLNDPGLLHQTGDFGWTVFPPYGEGGGGVSGENPFISVIELYVSPYDHWEGVRSRPPGEIVFSDLAAGQVIGFALIVNDWDEEEQWGVSWTPEAIQTDEYPESDIRFHRADSYLDGLLLPADPTRLESAVESVTWGRIKAALDLE